MRRTLLTALLAIATIYVVTGSTLAQSVSIADGVVPVAPGVTIRVLREASLVANPEYCCCNPKPVECRVRYETVPLLHNSPGAHVGVDAAGSAYHIANSYVTPYIDGDGIDLHRVTPIGVTENIAHLYRVRALGPGTTYFSFIMPFHFDATSGRILAIVGASVRPVSAETDFVAGIVEISGLPQLFDTFLTFVPGGQLAALMPAHPDGFRSADSVQVWTGNVRSMPDWTQAEPLACEAAANPAPGQLLSVVDTLPDPALGEGRYYLVASQSGADRRLGRQYVNGAFSAREPAGLPVCQ